MGLVGTGHGRRNGGRGGRTASGQPKTLPQPGCLQVNCVALSATPRRFCNVLAVACAAPRRGTGRGGRAPGGEGPLRKASSRLARPSPSSGLASSLSSSLDGDQMGVAVCSDGPDAGPAAMHKGPASATAAAISALGGGEHGDVCSALPSTPARHAMPLDVASTEASTAGPLINCSAETNNRLGDALWWDEATPPAFLRARGFGSSARSWGMARGVQTGPSCGERTIARRIVLSGKKRRTRGRLRLKGAFVNGPSDYHPRASFAAVTHRRGTGALSLYFPTSTSSLVPAAVALFTGVGDSGFACMQDLISPAVHH